MALSNTERVRRFRQRQKHLDKLPAELFPLPELATEPEPEPQGYPIPDPPDDPASALVEWAESTLVVPDGMLQGKPFRIDRWQEAFLREALSPGIREAGLSVARKNGKSGLIAVLLLGHLQGPLHRLAWRSVVTSMTGELAKELRGAVANIAYASGLTIDDRSSPTPGRVLGPNRTRVDFLAADKATGHGVGADLAIIDEAGLMQENQRSLFNAMLSSTSGRDGRAIYISIQGDGPMFREVGQRAGDTSVAWHCYQPDPRCALDDPEAWAAGNPGLASGIKSLRYMEDMARRAMSSPSDQPTFRAYDLNLPQDPARETICLPDQWDACETPNPPARDGECVVGIDLGGAASMTAAAAIWPATGRMEVRGAFPGTPALTDRGVADGVGTLYVTMADRGELRTYPGRVTPVGVFLGDVADWLSGETIIAVGADRYRRAETVQAMTDAGLAWPMRWRGQGASATADGSHDVRAFQRLVLSAYLRIEPSLLMMQAIADSAVTRDPRGNPALDKSRARGRIDALSAAVIAAGLAEIERRQPKRQYESLLI